MMQVGQKPTFFHRVKMDLSARIQNLIEPALADLGYSVVEVRLTGSSHLKLEVTIERLDAQSVGIDDCVKASREMSALLDVEDPIKSSYSLEVSSPGLERPLVKKEDFKRFVGEEIKVKTYQTIKESKRFKGVLTDATDESITIESETNGEAVVIAYEQIQRAKLSPKF
jgi:ribosome maturation factor RimP